MVVNDSVIMLKDGTKLVIPEGPVPGHRLEREAAFEKFTLADHLVKYFPSMQSNRQALPDLCSGGARLEAIRHFAPICLDFTYRPASSHNKYGLFTIALGQSIPQESLDGCLRRFYGPHYDTLMSTDIAQTLELGNSGRTFSLKDPAFMSYFTELQFLQKYEGEQVYARSDPWLLLMCVNTQARPFLSCCLDIMKEEGTLMHYEPEECVNAATWSGPLVTLKSALAVAEKYGITQIQQYLDAVSVIQYA